MGPLAVMAAIVLSGPVNQAYPTSITPGSCRSSISANVRCIWSWISAVYSASTRNAFQHVVLSSRLGVQSPPSGTQRAVLAHK